MTLEKAMEILTVASKHPCPAEHKDFGDALKLGIEALKQLKAIRGHPNYQWEYVLPGETKD